MIKTPICQKIDKSGFLLIETFYVMNIIKYIITVDNLGDTGEECAMKNLFKHLKLSLMAAIIMLLTPLVIITIVSVFYMGSQEYRIYAEADDIYFDTLYAINSDLVNADRDFYQAMIAATQCYDLRSLYKDLPEDELQGYLDVKLAEYEENKEQALERVDTAIAIAEENADIYTGTVIEGDTMNFADYAEAFEVGYAEWVNTYDLASDTGDWDGFNRTFETARAALAGMSDIVEKWAIEEKTTMEEEILQKIIVLCVAMGVIIILLIILAASTAKSLSKGIKRVSAVVGMMADGDFVTPIVDNSPVKEFRDIAQATENMRERLQEALLQVKENALSVNNGAEETKINIEDSQKMTLDINHAVSDIANGATEMANDVQSASEVTVSIGNSVDAVLESANGNMEKGRTVYAASERAQGQLDDLKIAGKNTQIKVEQINDSVHETSAVVKQISSSAETIIAIASQTNLLALNASIEAARAGEAGRGFAVVADNIKGLAEESDEAANEITDMLKKIADLSEQNKNLTEEIKEATETEEEALQSMGESFENMLVLLQETEEGNRQILSQVEVLNNDKNTILDSVESLSSVSQQNAAATEETSASLTMLDENMDHVVSQANSLKDIADKLQENISIFKV